MTDRELISKTFDSIRRRYGEIRNPAEHPAPHRTVALASLADGVIGNGGFQYLFERDIPGDPEYRLTREAFQMIGAEQACAAFDKAFALFPNSIPPADPERRVAIWQERYPSPIDALRDPDSPNVLYFDAMKEREQALAAYIRANWSDFEGL